MLYNMYLLLYLSSHLRISLQQFLDKNITIFYFLKDLLKNYFEFI